MSHSAENVNRDVTVSHVALHAFAIFGARLSIPLTLARLVLDDATIRVVLCHLGGAYADVGGSLAEDAFVERLSLRCIDTYLYR